MLDPITAVGIEHPVDPADIGAAAMPADDAVVAAPCGESGDVAGRFAA